MTRRKERNRLRALARKKARWLRGYRRTNREYHLFVTRYSGRYDIHFATPCTGYTPIKKEPEPVE